MDQWLNGVLKLKEKYTKKPTFMHHLTSNHFFLPSLPPFPLLSSFPFSFFSLHYFNIIYLAVILFLFFPPTRGHIESCQDRVSNFSVC